MTELKIVPDVEANGPAGEAPAAETHTTMDAASVRAKVASAEDNGSHDVECAVYMAQIGPADDKSTEALRSIDSEEKRAEMEKILQRATEIWEAFGKAASDRFQKPSARQVSQAVLALDCLLRSDQGQLWMNIGIAVQEARTAVKAVGELGRGLLELIKQVNETGGKMTLDTAALESALGLCDKAAEPVALPEGSTRTDPLIPVRADEEGGSVH